MSSRASPTTFRTRGTATTPSTDGSSYPTRNSGEAQDSRDPTTGQINASQQNTATVGKVAGGTALGAIQAQELATLKTEEAVSEKVVSEIERTSEKWVTGRFASEVERTRSNASPAPSTDHA